MKLQDVHSLILTYLQVLAKSCLNLNLPSRIVPQKAAISTRIAERITNEAIPMSKK